MSPASKKIRQRMKFVEYAVWYKCKRRLGYVEKRLTSCLETDKQMKEEVVYAAGCQ